MASNKNILYLRKLLRVNVIYSIYINLKHFGLKGLVKFPILVEYRSNIKASRGSLIFKKALHFNMLTINKKNTINIEKGGKIILNGERACFNLNNTVLVFSNGVLEIGNNFYANGFAEFNCKKKMSFGENVLISVHVMFLDTDFHPIFNLDGEKLNDDQPVLIENNVWISCNVTILKGSEIYDNIIIGAGSVITQKKLTEKNAIYGGNPVKLLKTGITWHA